MADGLGAANTIVYDDGSVQPQDQLLAGIPPGVGRSQVTLAAGNEGQLLPYNKKRIFASIDNPAAGVAFLLGLGDATVTGADFTVELAPGDYYEVRPEVVVGSVRALNNGAGPGTLRVTEITISAD